MYSLCCPVRPSFVPACTGLNGPCGLIPAAGAASAAIFVAATGDGVFSCDWHGGRCPHNGRGASAAGAAAAHRRELLLKELGHGLHLRPEQLFERRACPGGCRRSGRALAATTVKVAAGCGCSRRKCIRGKNRIQTVGEHANARILFNDLPEGHLHAEAALHGLRRLGQKQRIESQFHERSIEGLGTGGNSAQFFKEACHNRLEPEPAFRSDCICIKGHFGFSLNLCFGLLWRSRGLPRGALAATA